MTPDAATLAKLNPLIQPGPDDRHTPDERFRLSVERMRHLWNQLGRPLDGVPLILIGGTSGKGSVAMICAEVLRVHGLQVGTYTSPFLQTEQEITRVNGELIALADAARLVERVLPAIEAVYAAHPALSRPHYLEAWMAIALCYFAEQNVEAAVIEVGMGGRYDRTNALDPTVSVINTVNLDHTDRLGPTVESIAWHQAGILRTGRAAVLGTLPPEARRVIEQEADGVQLIEGAGLASPTTHGLDYDGARLHLRDAALGLAGPHQVRNAGVALRAVEAFSAARPDLLTLDEAKTRAALARVRFAGRLETVQQAPPVVLDGAHNGEKVAALLRAVQAANTYDRLVVVLGLLRAKEAADIVAQFTGVADVLITTRVRVPGKPAYSAEELAAVAQGAQVMAEDDPFAALDRALAIAEPGDLVLVTGSLYLVGQLRERWYPREAISRARTMFPPAPEPPARGSAPP